MSIRTSRLMTLLFTFAATSMAGCDDASEPELQAEALEIEAAELSPEAAAELAVLDEDELYVGVSDRLEPSFTAGVRTQLFRMLPFVSEETRPAECGPNEVVTGFDCDGRFCDNVGIECHAYPGTLVGAGEWSNWFEHNGKVLHVCEGDQYITGLDCWGDYCDNIAIRCTSAPSLRSARCAWTEWYSEENPSPFFADVGDAIKGIWCSGQHCDNKRFFVCET